MDAYVEKMNYSAVLRRRQKAAPHHAVEGIVVGEFRESASYHTWRPHGTDDWLYLQTVAGAGMIRDLEGRGTRLTAGEVLIYRPGTVQDYGTDAALGRWHLLWSHFHPRTHWLPWLRGEELFSGAVHWKAPKEVAREMERLLREARQAGREDAHWRTDRALHCLEGCLLRLNRETEGRRARVIDERIEEVIRQIVAHPERHRTIADLALMAGLSPSRFAHLFREQTGRAPGAMQEEERMRLAREYLAFTRQPVESVAERVGYEDPYHFSRRFKACTGRSPRAYRQRVESGESR